MNIKFSATPFRTVRADVVVPVSEATRAKRSISAQAGKRGLGKRLSVREHTFGRYVRIGVIYSKKA